MPANYVLLQRIELNASAASVTFSNIPQSGYTDLKIVFSGRDGTAQIYGDGVIRFNNDSASNYSRIRLEGNGTSAASAAQTTTGITGWNSNGSSSTANTFCSFEMYVPNYLSSSQKSVSIECVVENNATTAYDFLIAGLWTGTAAINQVSIVNSSSSFVAGTTASLYGLAAVGTTPVIAPKATGGNLVTTDGTYWIHTFTSSGTFTPLASLSNVDYLVVAGGGGGGLYNAGGGGAGGFRCSAGSATSGGGSSLESALSLTNTTYNILVGGGGSSLTKGNDSTFSTVTSLGGGNGGSSDTNNATSGGSGGGGGGGGNQPGKVGTANQGKAGGNGLNISSGNPGGGGGGALTAGGDASGGGTGQAGNGGNGISNILSGSSLVYGDGGGGSCQGGGGLTSNGSGGTGTGGSGIGGGGVGNSASPANRGSGGGGGGATAGSGSSGIVIIRYAV